jgi:hypothetical protein
MAKKEEIYPDGYPRQTENFSDAQKFKLDVFEAIKDVALNTTEKAFGNNGYKKKEGKAGEYATGAFYGAGTELNHYNIRLSSRPNTDTYIEKIIYFGGKKAISIISIGWDAKSQNIEITYKTSEFEAFRGYGSKEGPFLINAKENFNIKSTADFKKELTKMFNEFAAKEVAYITKTKIGIEDKTEKSIDSMVESFKNETNSMKKYTLKSLMASSDEELSNTMENYISEGKAEKPKDNMNSPEVIAANSPGKLLFDEFDEKDIQKKLDKFQAKSIEELKPSEKKTVYDELKSEQALREVTASGGNANGGAYQTPYAFKPGGDLNLGDTQKRKFEDTNYAKSKKQRPSVKKSMKEGDTFWTEVELNPGSGYVPKGMEKNFVMGKHEENLKESNDKSNNKSTEAGILKESLVKRKFTTMNENKDSGVNKRYIITEKRTQEEEESRWKKLSMFETYETIRNAENLNESQTPEEPKKVIKENEEHNDKNFFSRNSDVEIGGEVDGKMVVLVPKPNSLSNAMFKVFESDYLNESKAYILDLNSGNLVSNPNFRVKKD